MTANNHPLSFTANNNYPCKVTINLNLIELIHSKADYAFSNQYAGFKMFANPLADSEIIGGTFVSKEMCACAFATSQTIFVAHINTLILASIIAIAVLYQQGCFAKLNNYFYPQEEDHPVVQNCYNQGKS